VYYLTREGSEINVLIAKPLKENTIVYQKETGKMSMVAEEPSNPAGRAAAAAHLDRVS